MSHGNTLRYTFVPTLAASWVLYMLLLRRRGPDRERLMPLYFVSLAWQFVHFIEENQTGFRYRWPVEIFGTEPYGDKQYVAINVLSYALFILGGVALMVDRREFSLPAVFFAVMGVMFNGVQHPIYSWMARGYFPGLWTSTVDLATPTGAATARRAASCNQPAALRPASSANPPSASAAASRG